MAGWRRTCRVPNWVCMLYRWLAGALVMIAVSRWPGWQLHAGRPRPACLFLSGSGTLSKQFSSLPLITPSCPPCCLLFSSSNQSWNLSETEQNESFIYFWYNQLWQFHWEKLFALGQKIVTLLFLFSGFSKFHQLIGKKICFKSFICSG